MDASEAIVIIQDRRFTSSDEKIHGRQWGLAVSPPWENPWAVRAGGEYEGEVKPFHPPRKSMGGYKGQQLKRYEVMLPGVTYHTLLAFLIMKQGSMLHNPLNKTIGAEAETLTKWRECT